MHFSPATRNWWFQKPVWKLVCQKSEEISISYNTTFQWKKFPRTTSHHQKNVSRWGKCRKSIFEVAVFYIYMSKSSRLMYVWLFPWTHVYFKAHIYACTSALAPKKSKICKRWAKTYTNYHRSLYKRVLCRFQYYEVPREPTISFQTLQLYSKPMFLSGKTSYIRTVQRLTSTTKLCFWKNFQGPQQNPNISKSAVPVSFSTHRITSGMNLIADESHFHRKRHMMIEPACQTQKGNGKRKMKIERNTNKTRWRKK